MWDEGYALRSSHDVVQQGRIVGRVETESRLRSLDRLMKEVQERSATSDGLLCGRDGGEVLCFPSRHYETGRRFPLLEASGRPALPVSKALLGEAGSEEARDLRGTRVLAGYVPLAGHPLALVEKIDVAELYFPLRDKVSLLALVVLGFIAAGTMLLQKLVRPALAQVIAERQRMKSILDNSLDAFVAVDAGGAVRDWNPQAERVFGWSAQEALGRDLESLLFPQPGPPASPGSPREPVLRGAAAASSRRMEVLAVGKDGEEIPVELSVATFADGASRATSAFLRDLREQKAAEKALDTARSALAHSQKLEAVGKLTGGIAHDFNNVLQVVKVSLQLLKLENEGSETVQKRVALAAGAVDRGAKLSAQLLAFARKQPLKPASTHLGRVLREMNDLLQRAIGESVEIETVVAGGLWNTFVDPGQLEHVILNLAINARDAMKGAGRLTIEVGNAHLDEEYVRIEPGLKPGQYVMLAVSDTGCGMSPEVAAHAFEPFFTTKPEGQGTGLGLSMAYGFVKQSGGHIRIYSEVGHGTTIRIYLPRSFEKEEAVRVAAAGKIEGGRETILVVEDDLAVQAAAVDILTGLGYRVLKADNAEMALGILDSGVAVDLLFTDVVMPGVVRSPELARRARMLLPDIQVLFTSGYTQNAIVHGGRLDPGVHLLSKPYGREQLARKIRELLANRSKEAVSS